MSEPDSSTAARRQEAAASLLRDMEAAAARMRELIVSMPPQDLLGYLYAQYMLKVMFAQDGGAEAEEPSESAEPDDLINDNQFLLEYVHAVLASDPLPEQVDFNEAKCTELYDVSRKLRQDAMFYAMATSAETKGGPFGPDTADIEYRAKATWVLMRGNRYQVLEGEFYRYVLAPHDDLLKEVYGVGAEDIATGFQAMTEATRSGYSDAIDWPKVNDKATAAALLTGGDAVTGIIVVATADDTYKTAYTFPVHRPGPRSEDNARIYDEADRMRSRKAPLAAPRAPASWHMPVRASVASGARGRLLFAQACKHNAK